MAQTHTVGSHATNVFSGEGFTRVVYHSTIVVKWNGDEIVLDTGGYETVTTKLRMNQASTQYGLGFYVYQKDFQWYVKYKGKDHKLEGRTITLQRGDELNI